MATTLGSMAEDSIIKLKENGVLVDFYIAKHNYESGRNGSGRTLLVRKECYDKRKWHSSDVNAYATSDIDTWLNGTYKKLFDADIQAAMGETTFHYTPGNGDTTKTTLKRAVFLLSATELGKTNKYLNAEGTALSSTVIDLLEIAYIGGSAVVQWTRSPNTNLTTNTWILGYDGGLSHNYCSYSIGSRPAFTLPSTLCVSDDGSVSVNTAPTTPGSISVPPEISGGTTISVSWAASSDAEGNLAGYIVEKSTNGGSTWTEIYRAQSTATSTNDNVVFGTASVMYRVKAFDTEGLESGWRTSSNITVTNNRAPTAPASITVPMTVQGGADLVISWGAATDSDGNLAGYELERWRYGGAGWEQIFRGNARAFTDHIEKGWTVVFYRVRAYDSNNAYSGYTTSQERMVNNNTAPVITCGYPSGSDLGTKAYGFTVDYSVNDEDGDAVTATEAIDGVTKRTFQATPKQSCSFQIAGDYFQRVLNGKHILTVTADDGKAATVHKLTFTKEVTKATITLETPMDADGEITLAILSVMGSIPADAKYKVEVTNNGKDDLPAWQDVTAEVRAGANIVFANHTAKNGFAFNFRVTVERGGSGVGGYITSVQGGFQ